MALWLSYIKIIKSDLVSHEEIHQSTEDPWLQYKSDTKDFTGYYDATGALLRHCYKEGFI